MNSKRNCEGQNNSTRRINTSSNNNRHTTPCKNCDNNMNSSSIAVQPDTLQNSENQNKIPIIEDAIYIMSQASRPQQPQRHVALWYWMPSLRPREESCPRTMVDGRLLGDTRTGWGGLSCSTSLKLTVAAAPRRVVVPDALPASREKLRLPNRGRRSPLRRSVSPRPSSASRTSEAAASGSVASV